MSAATLDLGFLAKATHEEAAAFFHEIDAEALVARLTELPDKDLLDLVGREEVRTAAVAGILSRLDEYADPERLAAVTGRVRFDLERRGKLLERHSVVFTGGGLEVPEPDDGGTADVVLHTSLLRFVRLVSGENNAALEYLSGKLDIEGDANLALAVGGIFRVPGHREVAVDPTTLDPDEVAVAVSQASTDHLRSVMRSDFRPIVLSEIFRRLPSFVDQRRAAKTHLTVGFRLTGAPGSEPDRYVVRIDAGVATVETGDGGGADVERDATIMCEAHDFLRLATGQMNAVTGVLKGQLKVKGDKAKALELSSVIDFPKGR